MEYLRRKWSDFETPQNGITIKKEIMNSNIEFVNDTLNGSFLSGFVEDASVMINDLEMVFCMIEME